MLNINVVFLYYRINTENSKARKLNYLYLANVFEFFFSVE